MTTTTVLLVEDDPNDAFFFENVWKKAGILNPLRVAKDGQEALDYLEGAGEFADRDKYPLPSLTILDLKLPRVMGIQVLKRIREQPALRKLIVIVLTSSVSDADISQVYELGANAYLVKPSEMDGLADIVRAIKHFWLTHNHAPRVDG
jgi:two-component system response regulator